MSMFLFFSPNSDSIGRMIGMVRSVSKLPTYRRRFRHVVKALSAYSIEKNGLVRTGSVRSVNSI